MQVGTLSKRVNLRVSEETFNPYDKVASFFNVSVPDLMRQALEASIPTMDALGVIIDRAKAGDKDAVDQLFHKLINMHQGTLDLAREMTAAEKATASEAAPDSTSNTVR